MHVAVQIFSEAMKAAEQQLRSAEVQPGRAPALSGFDSLR